MSESDINEDIHDQITISKSFLNPPSLESFGFTPLESMSCYTKPSDVLTLSRDNINLPSLGPDYVGMDLELISNMLGPGYPFDPDDGTFDSIHATCPPNPTTKLSPKLCKDCPVVHSSFELPCNQSCDVCYSKGHFFGNCPYLDYIPQGADFDRESYEVHCQCGYPFFDTTTWVCSAKFCGGYGARLCPKECDICDTYHDHTTYECPKDKDRAASSKSFIKDYFENFKGTLCSSSFSS